ncbi:MAG: hypothetical protein ACMXYC_02405 [Candidatus Woesearchaeota archaeon]
MRQGQVTLFIVLGVLLLGGLITYTVVRMSMDTVVDDMELRVLSTIPSDLEPIRMYMQQCLDNVATDAAHLLGAQGGHIYTDRFFVNPLDVTDGDGVLINDQIVPYWYHMISDNTCENNCIFNSYYPELTGVMPTTIEQQMQRYIAEHIVECGVEDAFAFDIVAVDEPEVQVFFSRFKTLVYMVYPLEVTYNNEVVIVQDYQVLLDFPLRELYEYAILIASAQTEFMFLENHMLQVIALSTAIDREALPPFYGTTFERYSSIYWLRSEVVRQIQDLLSSYIQALQIPGTRNYNPVRATSGGRADAALNSIYLNMEVPLDQVYDPGRYETYFSYMGWPFYFDINHRGELIRPDSFSLDIIPFFGMQMYNNLYDVSFPAVVRIVDPQAFNGRGYSFQFALEGNIRLNERFGPNSTIISSTYDQQIPLFCEHATSAPVSFKVVDEFSGEDIDDALISYGCGRLSCQMGVAGEVNQSFPICGGGHLTIVHPNYRTYTLDIDFSLDDPLDLGQIGLSAVQEYVINVVKIPVRRVNGEWTPFFNEQTVFGADAHITLMLQEVDGDGFAGVELFGSTPGTIRLHSGLYDVQGMVVGSEPLVIEPQEQCFRVLLSETCVDIPEETLIVEEPPLGGFSHPLFGIRADTTAQQVTFYMFGIDYPSNPTIDDMNGFNAIDELSLVYAQRMFAEFR